MQERQKETFSCFLQQGEIGIPGERGDAGPRGIAVSTL